MTKADIAERVQAGSGLARKGSVGMMEALFSIINPPLEQGEGMKF